jgi:excinuclease ABC subunit B
MGPHAMTPPRGGKPLPPKPTLSREFDDPAEKKGRKGRPRKTGRPGR